MLFPGTLHPWELLAWQGMDAIPLWCLALFFLQLHPVPAVCLEVPLWGTACPGTETLLARGRETKKLWDVRTGTAKSLPASKKGPGPGRGWTCLAKRFWAWICCRKSQQEEFCPQSSSKPIPVSASPTPSRRKSGIPKFRVSNRNCLSLGFNRQKKLLKPDFFWHLLALLRKSWPGKLAEGDELEKL